jgi:hypothetical protein
VKYSEAKKFIRDGDVLTFAGHWWISRAIRWFTGQPVSHVGFAIWLRFGLETEDRLCVLESMEPGGIRVVPLSLTMGESDATYWQKMKWEVVNGNEAIGWALRQWGGRYASWLQFLSFVSPRFRWFRELVGLPPKIGDGWHCSGLVAQALRFGGFEPPKDPSLVTPGDLWDFTCLEPPVPLELE